MRYKGSDIHTQLTDRNMMKSLSRFSLLLFLLLLPVASFATQGKVVAFNAKCGYLLVAGAKGSLLLKQQGGSGFVPAKDDVIQQFDLH